RDRQRRRLPAPAAVARAGHPRIRPGRHQRPRGNARGACCPGRRIARAGCASPGGPASHPRRRWGARWQQRAQYNRQETMTPWLDALRTRPASAGDAVLVTVLSVRGSAPREPGAKMLVDLEGIAGTIGGGVLEHRCAKLACEVLKAAGEGPVGARVFTHKFPLGPGMGQCCGGVVEVLFERVDARTDWIRHLLECHEQRRAAVLATELPVGDEGTKLVVTADGFRIFGSSSVHVQPMVDAARGLLADRGPARRAEAT